MKLVPETLTYGAAPLSKVFDAKFGDLYWNNELQYSVNQTDLKFAFDAINHHGFNNALAKMPIMTPTVKWCDKRKIVGAFRFAIYEDDGIFKCLAKTPGFFVVRETHTNMINAFGILGHEMIHAFDLKYGPLRHHMTENVFRNETTQFVGTYDVHSQFFTKQKHFLTYKCGLPVYFKGDMKARYMITKDKTLMERMLEDDQTLTENELEEAFQQHREWIANLSEEEKQKSWNELFETDAKIPLSAVAENMKKSLKSDTPLFIEEKNGILYGVIT